MPIDLLIDPEFSSTVTLDLAQLQASLVVLAELTSDKRLDREVCVRVCGEAESQSLNASYRGKDKPTNVLSFPAEIDLPDLDLPLGDLAICWPVVAREAALQNKNENNHLTHLFVHGVLHLLGFDHETDADANVMEALEVRTLAKLQIPNPYELCH